MNARIPIPVGYHQTDDVDEPSTEARIGFHLWLDYLIRDRKQAVLPFIRVWRSPIRIVFADGSNPPFKVYTNSANAVVGILAEDRRFHARPSYENLLASWFDVWPWVLTGIRSRIIFLRSREPRVDVLIAVPNQYTHILTPDTAQSLDDEDDPRLIHGISRESIDAQLGPGRNASRP